MIRLLQLEHISNHAGFSLQMAATLLINEIREITSLMVNGISYTLLMESTTKPCSCGPIIMSKETNDNQETTLLRNFEFG